MLIKYNKARVCRAFDRNGAAVLFIPGINEVGAGVWKRLQENPHFMRDVRKGDYSVESETEPRGNTTALTVFENVRDAFVIIKETYDKALLNRWKLGEERKTIVDAIDAQLTRIEKRTRKKKSVDPTFDEESDQPEE